MVLLIMSQDCFASMSLLSSIHVMTVDGTPMPLASVGFVVTPNLSLLLSLSLSLSLMFVIF